MRNLHILSLVVGSFLLAAGVSAAAPAAGSLVKLACGSGDSPTDPCRAVYYYGSDGKRHAFPNDKVFFSWYADFSSVKTVTPAEMAALPLGKNVTYRPGIRLVKFTTDPKTYAIGLGGELRWVTSEAAAVALYGSAWAKGVHDISDAAYLDYRFGADIASAAAFSPSSESALARTFDDELPVTKRSVTVTTAGGSFAVDVVKLRKDGIVMHTTTAETTDCVDGCDALALADHASRRGARYGIHGTYFCPPDYADCAAKRNTFLWPVFDSATRTLRNASALPYHNGPILVAHTDGTYAYLHRTSQFGVAVSGYESATGKTVAAAIANYPSLVEGGTKVVLSEPMLDDGMKTVKGTRAGIGMNDRYVNLVVAKSATVPDLADIMVALGMTDAMNLDGGGSTAMLFDGTYVTGPGRLLPNAIVFSTK
jgi:hypothetical protein